MHFEHGLCTCDGEKNKKRKKNRNDLCTSESKHRNDSLTSWKLMPEKMEIKQLFAE